MSVETPLPLPLPLQKHIRYGDAYKANEEYWGIGIENESYLQRGAPLRVPASFLLTNRKRERYSVDYWNTYKKGVVDQALTSWYTSLRSREITSLDLPVLLNAHTFTRTDRFGQPKMTYALHPEPNPLFCGTTLLEDLCRLNPAVFQEGRDVWWCFDGDTVEFMTQKFYCSTLEDCIDELVAHKEYWIKALRKGLSQLDDRESSLVDTIIYPDVNHGLAVFLTNRNHVSPFNNGTYHINLTLPTHLNAEARIADPALFLSQHRCLARMFQWISPFLVARFGSGDILGTIPGYEDSFPRGSQRLCACRYVGVGTYDTEKMMRGKLLTLPYERIDGRWYEIIHGSPVCSYEGLPALGMDINTQKHWNHGLEFRIFDWFPESRLPDLMRLLVWLADESLTRGDFPNPHQDPLWNQVLARCVWEGGDTVLSQVEATRFRDILRVPGLSTGTAIAAYDTLWSHLGTRWNQGGPCTSRMIRDPLVSVTQTYCLPFSETMGSLPSGLPPVSEEPTATATATATATSTEAVEVAVAVSSSATTVDTVTDPTTTEPATATVPATSQSEEATATPASAPAPAPASASDAPASAPASASVTDDATATAATPAKTADAATNTVAPESSSPLSIEAVAGVAVVAPNKKMWCCW